jgi:hypothetical protein
MNQSYYQYIDIIYLLNYKNIERGISDDKQQKVLISYMFYQNSQT